MSEQKITPQLNFYTRPFHKDSYNGWIYDAKDNFVFQFEKPISKDKEAIKNIIFRLNALDKETEIIPDYNLMYDHKKAEILNVNEGNVFITIRGWGNLTGTGGYNFDGKKASKIQDDFAHWLVDRLTNTPK